MTLKFKLVQPGEYYEYFYNIVGDDNVKHGEIRYIDNAWLVAFIIFPKWIESYDWISIGEKINELNAATKADKLFGFL